MSTTPYKPVGYPSVSPYLVVTDAAASIAFIEKVFHATEVRRYPDPSGKRLMHAEVRIDDSIVMLGDCAEQWPATQCHVHLYVPDVDAVYANALKEGATSLQEPVKKEDEDKRGGFKDAWGTSWWIATKVE